ncbi:MAG: amidohydrolase [Acidobacteria bacterium]|nr:amidohydrolase [Acidobacteriota bacterium]
MKCIPACLALAAVIALAQPRPTEKSNLPPLTFEEYEPRTGVVLPQHPVTRAKFPFIDVHNHQNGAMAPEQLDKLVKDMDSINLQVMVNLSGGYGDRLQATIRNMKGGQYRNRFVVFANMNFAGLDDPDYPTRVANQLEADIKAGAQGLKIFKNFGMDMKDGKGQRIHVDDGRFDKAFEICAKYNVPVLIHTAEPRQFFDPIDKNNERWLELKQFPGRARPPERYPTWQTLMDEQHALFARHPRTKFINAHLGWMGGDLGALGKLFDRLPNVYTELGAVIAEIGRQPRFAREFFTKYQDRIMMGKDIWSPPEYHIYFRIFETGDEYFDYYRKRHAFWKMYGMDLPDAILKKIYYKNALKVIPGIDASAFPR